VSARNDRARCATTRRAVEIAEEIVGRPPTEALRNSFANVHHRAAPSGAAYVEGVEAGHPREAKVGLGLGASDPRPKPHTQLGRALRTGLGIGGCVTLGLDWAPSSPPMRRTQHFGIVARFARSITQRERGSFRLRLQDPCSRWLTEMPLVYGGDQREHERSARPRSRGIRGCRHQPTAVLANGSATTWCSSSYTTKPIRARS